MKKLPGNKDLVSSKETLEKLAQKETKQYKYQVEDFMKKPAQSAFQFSPNGLYLSYKEKDLESKNHVYVKNTKTNKVTRIIEEDENLIAGYAWANDNRIIYLKDNGGDENNHLFAVDLDGKNLIELTPFEGVKVMLLDMQKEQKDFLIILMNKENREVFEPFLINIKNGETKKLLENIDKENPIIDFSFNKKGVLKAYTKQQNGSDYALYFRTKESDYFKKTLECSWKESITILGFNDAEAKENQAYILTNIKNNTKEIILYDFEKNKVIKKLYTNPTFDIQGLGFSRKRNYEIDFYVYNGEKKQIIPVSESFKKLHHKLTSKFTGNQFSIVSKTENEDKYLILVNSDKLYGVYYMYDSKTDEFKELLNLRPDIDPEEMAEMRSIQYKSRDGLIIYAYLSIPNEVKKGKKVPLIVNPHGGPYGVRDSWGFNPETQLFASRGFATLQVNYRGSGGYGKDFYLAGSKQIGRKMLEDLEDGVAFVKKMDIIDEKKLAIYGASYGGLATLGSLVKTPDLYTCGVDYVGVSNLFSFVKSFPAYWKPFMKTFYEQWYNEENAAEAEIMKQVSPALNVDKITKALFVVQGANDPRVNIDESDQIVQNLRNRGFDVPYMVKYNEGHGFRHEENSIELYKTMMGFFAQYLN